MFRTSNILFLLTACLSLEDASCWLSSVSTGDRRSIASSASATTALHMNMFTDIGNMLGGGKLTPQEELVHGEPLGPINDSDEVLTLAIQERAISFTGEDFDVYDLRADQPFCHVKGAMLHLPGKDKMRVFMENGDKVAVLDRKLIAMTPTYDIHRGNGEKMGWIEKEVVALTDTFDVYTEQAGGFGMFKPPPAYRIEGDFVDRQFVMKNSKGEAVAKVTKDSWIQFDAFNHYQLQIAPGMDTTLVVACACAIDEEFDEEHKKKKEE